MGREAPIQQREPPQGFWVLGIPASRSCSGLPVNRWVFVLVILGRDSIPEGVLELKSPLGEAAGAPCGGAGFVLLLAILQPRAQPSLLPLGLGFGLQTFPALSGISTEQISLVFPGFSGSPVTNKCDNLGSGLLGRAGVGIHGGNVPGRPPLARPRGILDFTTVATGPGVFVMEKERFGVQGKGFCAAGELR